MFVADNVDRRRRCALRGPSPALLGATGNAEVDRGGLTVDREPAAIELCVARLTQQGRRQAAEGSPPAPIHVIRDKHRR